MDAENLLPSADSSIAWEPTPGASGAAPNTAPETLYYLNDMLGSPLALLNQNSEVALRYHYDAFGTPEEPEKFDLNYPGPDNLFGYTGLGYDYTSGLSYARSRYFDSEIGRFVSQDTYEGDVKNPQSLNMYAYVENNPLRYMDPTGHFSFETSDYRELEILLNEAREKSNYSKKNYNYQLYKDFIRDRYDFESILGENQYNYLYDLLTGTSAYTNNKGRATWAKAQLLSEYQNWTEVEVLVIAASGLIGGGGAGSRSVVKRTPKGMINGISRDTIIKTATAPKKGGETVVGHALQKHAGRNPNIWGKIKGGADQINQTALKHLKEIIDSPGDFNKVTNGKGITFLEKKLLDGRGVRLNLDGTFKGFIDQ